MRVRKEQYSDVTVTCHKQFLGRKLNGVLASWLFYNNPGRKRRQRKRYACIASSGM